MDDPNSVGKIDVTVGADLSDLQPQFDAAERQAKAAADAIAGAFNSTAGSSQTAASGIDQVASSSRGAGEAAQQAEGGFQAMSQALVGLGAAFAAADGLKRFGEAALEAYGSIQRVQISVKALTDSSAAADLVLQEVKRTALTSPFDFPEIEHTAQRMIAMGVSINALPTALHALVDSAAATGNSLLVTSSAFDRITESGQLQARQIQQLGLTLEQTAKSMGTTRDQVAAAFKDLPDQAARVEALTKAMERFGGVAAAQAQGVEGAWHVFGNQFTIIMQDVGEALAPAIADLLKFGRAALDGMKAATDAFNSLPAPVKEVAGLLAIAAAAVVPLAASIGALGVGIIGAKASIDAVGAALTILGLRSGEAAAAQTAQAAAAGELAIAETAAAESEVAAAAGGGAIATAMTGAAAAVNIAAAAFIGFKVGEWAYANVPGVKALGDSLADLINKIPGVESAVMHLSGVSAGLKAALDSQSEGTFALAQKLASLGIVIERGSLTMDEWGARLRQAASEYEGTTAGTNKYGVALDNLLSKHKDLGVELSKAQGMLAEASTRLAAGSITAAQYGEALKNLEDVQKKLNALNPVYADSLAGLTEKYNKNQTEAAALENTIASLLAITERTAAQNAILEEAEKRLDSIHKQLTESTKALTAAAQGPGIEYGKLTQTYDQLITKSIGLVAAVNDAKAALDRAAASGDHTQAGQIALTAAIDQYSQALNKAGISGQDFITVQQNGVDVQIRAADLVNQLRDATGGLTTTQQNGVTVLHATADAHEQAAKAAGHHAAAIRDLTGATQDFSDGESHSILTINSSTTALEHATTALEHASSATDAMTAAQDKLAIAAQNAAVAMAAESEVGASMNAWAKPGSTEKLGSANGVSLAAWLTSIQHDPSFSGFIDPSILSPWGPHVQSAEELNSLLNPTKPTTAPTTRGGTGTGASSSGTQQTTTSTPQGVSQQAALLQQASNVAAAAMKQAEDAFNAVSDAFLAGTATQGDLQKAAEAATSAEQAYETAQKALTDSTTSQTTATGQATQAAASQATAMTSLHDALGNSYSSVQALNDALAANPLLGGASYSTISNLKSFNTAMDQFRDGMGNLYPTIQALNDALAKTPGLGGPHVATSGSGNPNVSFGLLAAATGSAIQAGMSLGASPYGVGNFGNPSFGLPSSVLSNQSGASITVNVTGNTIKDQPTIDQLVTTLINKLRTQVNLKP